MKSEPEASSTTQVQTITINGQQYQIVSPAAEAIQALAAGAGMAAAAAAGGPASPSDVVQYAATSQNGQTVFIPGTVASTPGGAHVISVGSGGAHSPASPTGSLDMMPRSSEESARKREIRLLKNREAARECRNKKKEYIKCLENRVAVLENQNKALIEELKSLKELYTGQKS